MPIPHDLFLREEGMALCRDTAHHFGQVACGAAAVSWPVIDLLFGPAILLLHKTQRLKLVFDALRHFLHCLLARPPHNAADDALQDELAQRHLPHKANHSYWSATRHTETGSHPVLQVSIASYVMAVLKQSVAQ
jgi:hypothetical protein